MENNELNIQVRTNTGKGEHVKKAFCLKCRAETEVKDARSVTTKNGVPATEGRCSECGGKVYRMDKKLRQMPGKWAG
jgi:RNase P subunit RPR2